MSTTRPMNVLLVEDNPGDVLLTKQAVARLDADATMAVAVDGGSALAYLRGEGEHCGRVRPDFVLLDLNLPDMRGHDVLAAMKRDPVLRAMPVLILTSSSLREDVDEAYQAYANTYITKPDGMLGLRDVVRCIRDYWAGIALLPG
jgi:CheY-like chemotaxis protein